MKVLHFLECGCLNQGVFLFIYFFLDTHTGFGMKAATHHARTLGNVGSLSQQILAKIFKRTRREWEKSTDGGVGGVSVSFVGGERGREPASIPKM